MPPTNVPNFSLRRAKGFSLAEMLVALSLSAVVGAAVLSAYTFMARSLAHLSNYQRLEIESRRTLQLLNTDVRMAVALASPTGSSVTFTIPTASATTTVAYSYDAMNRTLTRTKGTDAPFTLMNGVQSFAFNFYDRQDAASTAIQSIKQVDVSYRTVAGDSAGATQAQLSTVSARMLLQNKRLMNEPL